MGFEEYIMWFGEAVENMVRRLSSHYFIRLDNFEQSWDGYNILNTVNIKTGKKLEPEFL